MTYRAISQPVDLHAGVWNLSHLSWRLLMTFDAPAHRLIDRAVDAIHLLNLAMAGLTCNARTQMRHVREVGVSRSRQTENAMPLRFGVFVGVLENLLHFGAVGFYRAMAERAPLHAGNEHARGATLAIFVAEIALDALPSGAFLSGMLPVTVGNGLHRRTRFAERSNGFRG